MEENDVLNEKYSALIVETVDGKKIATVTPYEITAAENVIIKLIPKLD